jgi:hypothetical protein
MSIALLGNRAAVVGRYGLAVVDVSEPGRPTVLGRFPAGADEAQGFSEVALADGRAYVIDNQALRVIDLTQPSVPQEVGRFPFVAPRGAVAVADGYVYLAAGSFWILR